MTEPRRLVIIGADAPTHAYFTWHWTEGDSAPHVWSVPRGDIDQMIERLTAALPDGDVDVEAMCERVFSGDFLDPKREGPLADEVGETLLSQDLRAALLAADTVVEVRVQPPASCGVVPWEWLGLGRSGLRVVDKANVVMIPPPLPREAAAEGLTSQEAPSTDGTGRFVLRVLDPFGALVLPNARQLFPNPDHNNVELRRPTDRRELSDRLRQRPRRMLFVGHVVGSTSDAKNTGLMLGCSSGCYGRGAVTRVERVRVFSAEDLALGTLGYTDRRPGIEAGEVPPAAQAGTDVREVPGRELWPMPPRVGVVACASGIDLKHVEPFGLVSAILDNGAELVTATRWTMLTDRAFDQWSALSEQAGAPGPFSDAARAVDQAHDADDPLKFLADWQRAHLRCWREGNRADSPITWAAVATYDGRSRWVDNSTASPHHQEMT